MTNLPPLTDDLFYHLEWVLALDEFSKRVVEQVRYQGKTDMPDPALAREIQRVGERVKTKNNRAMYKVTWPGRFTLIGYPTTGTCQFIPWNKRNYRAPFKNILNAFLVFLCGREPVVPSCKPPADITRLDYTREQALQVIANFQICFIGFEREVLNDPHDTLPDQSEVKMKFPASRHLPDANVRFRVNESGGTKEVETSGSPRETEFFDDVNFEDLWKEDPAFVDIDLADPGLVDGTCDDLFKLHANDLATPTEKNSGKRGALGISALREEIDHNREMEGKFDQFGQKVIDRMNRQQTVLEDLKDDNKQRGHLDAIRDRDNEEILKRLPPDLGKTMREVVTEVIEEKLQTLVRSGEEHSGLLREIRDGIHENTDVHRENNVLLQEHDNNEELRATDLANQLATHDDRTVAYHKDDVIRDNAQAITMKEIKDLLEQSHKSDLYRTAFLARRMDALDARLAAMETTLAMLAKFLDMTVQDFLPYLAEIRDQIEHLKSLMAGNRIHQDALNLITLIYIVLGKAGPLPVRRIAELLAIKPTRVYGLVNKLEALGLVTWEKKVPTLAPVGETISDPTEEVSSPKPRPMMRRIKHFFIRVFKKETKPESNKQLKPEDEKT